MVKGRGAEVVFGVEKPAGIEVAGEELVGEEAGEDEVAKSVVAFDADEKQGQGNGDTDYDDKLFISKFHRSCVSSPLNQGYRKCGSRLL